MGFIGFDGMDTNNVDAYACPPGHQCLFPFMQNWVSCPPGTYSVDGFWACQPCPDKQTCLLRGDTAVDANDGYFSLLGMHIPMVVPAGWYGGQANTLTPCKAGFYSDDKAGTCTQCVAGEVCTHRANQPQKCGEGLSSETAGLEACVPCAMGEVFNEGTKVCEAITEGYGSLHPLFQMEECPYGTYSTTATIGDGTKDDCQPC